MNSGKVLKPAHKIGPGDTLTFPQGRQIRVIRVVATAERRGPATEAQTLYEDLAPPPDRDLDAPRSERGGRPTKKDRRNYRQTRTRPLE